MLFNGIRMDQIIYLGKCPGRIPFKLLYSLFVEFEPREFFDQVEFEFRTYPGGELKSNILVGICPAVTTGFGDNADGIGGLYPFFWG